MTRERGGQMNQHCKLFVQDYDQPPLDFQVNKYLKEHSTCKVRTVSLTHTPSKYPRMLFVVFDVEVGKNGCSD